MSARNFGFWMLILASCCFIQAQPKMLDVPVTIMKGTELKIERGGCFVYWRPIYCTYPGTGYRIEAVNGMRRDENPIKNFSVRLNDNEALRWFASSSNRPGVKAAYA